MHLVGTPRSVEANLPDYRYGRQPDRGDNNDTGQISKYNYALSIMFSIAAQDRPEDERSTEIPGTKATFREMLTR